MPSNPDPRAAGQATLLMRKLWLRAASASAALCIPFASAKAAVKYRFAMYNMTKAVKRDATIDMELARAVDACELLVDGSTLIVQRRDLSPESLAVAAFLGEDTLAAPLTTAEEDAINASGLALMRRLQEEEEARAAANTAIEPIIQVHNPYPRRNS